MKTTLTFFLMLVSFQTYALDCDKAVTTPAINECGRIEQQKVEKELNVVYQRVLKHIESVSKNAETELQKNLKVEFIAAQRLWIKFREADCQNTYSLWSGGTIRGAMYIGCMHGRAEQRIKELKQYEPVAY